MQTQLNELCDEYKRLIACGDLAAFGTNKDLVRLCDLNGFLGAEPSPMQNVLKYEDKSWGYINRVPVFGVELPKGAKSKKDDMMFNEAELVTIFRAALEHPLYLTIALFAQG